ncbi:MAG: sigma 54-interacting transcriptional regulator [Sedimentibacter saalensis]|uniref:sigma-54 interaction domain-containing protein n=1 Tax=Sedimentibacter saalensis TaxID=130788 RepID=UPI002B21B75C|nr:sigma 54-interacting transcriptional regulator [Sedimentibacter saalensis]MEA5093510.1 sigma 54-interacting transcriptional regulator [Sedimentibacter saalensis]
MKKKLALIAIRTEIRDMYYAELVNVFSDYFKIVSYCLETQHSDPLSNITFDDTDIIIITNPDIFTIVKNYVKNDCKVIHLNYAFFKNKIEYLKTFPNNTNALVCFKFYSVSHQTASMLYEMGVKNLNLDVYNPERGVLNRNYDIAIVGDNSAIVPDNINKIVSLGSRKIAFSTLLDIATNAGILDDKLENRINSYCNDLMTPYSFMMDIYDNSTIARIQIQTIMDCIDYAIIMFDKNYNIINYNNNILSMFNINKTILNMNLNEIFEFDDVYKVILIEREFKNKLVEIKNSKNILVSKEKINKKYHSDNIYIVLMKDVTEIMNLENTFRKQLVKKGHIAKYTFDSIIGNSKEIKDCIKRAKIVSKIDKPTLITGESGTGKELFAQSIHNESSRKKFPFIAINCAALPSALLESELFGYEEGAFTGAKKGGKLGYFEMAHKGSLFLDEIGDINMETQAKLLRVLEEKEIMRVGSEEIISVDVRIIAATNRNLKELVKDGKFRLDLYYRLNTLIINIPPIRKRAGDIPLLIKNFLKNENLNDKIVNPDVIEFLTNFPWYGNVRELRNCIEYMSGISERTIKLEHLPEYILEEAMDNKTDIKEDILNNITIKDKNLLINIMETINYFGGGRRRILQELKLKNCNISEYKLRILLDCLYNNDLIKFGKGSSGAFLTEKGKKFMQNSC